MTYNPLPLLLGILFFVLAYLVFAPMFSSGYDWKHNTVYWTDSVGHEHLCTKKSTVEHHDHVTITWECP